MGEPTRYRWLLHVDLDQFQVSVERQRRADLIGLPVIVGGDGDPSRARQVVTCASYEARDLGVRAGMPMRVAGRKARDAVYLPLDMPAYEAASERVMTVLGEMADAVEVWGWDEAYLGFDDQEHTGTRTPGDVIAIAESIRRAVLAETGLQCCVGVSDNKQRAKAATGFAKDAIRDASASDTARVFVLDDTNWSSLMSGRPCHDLWSVGARTAAKLTAAGIDTVAQLAATEREDLTALFGPHQGAWLYVLSRGGGDDAIAAEPAPAKSHSKARTFDVDLTDRDDLQNAVGELTRAVLDQVLAEGRTPCRVGLTVRTSTFYTRTKVRRLAAPTTAFEPIIATATDLLDAFEIDRPIRLMAVRLELLDPDDRAADTAAAP